MIAALALGASLLAGVQGRHDTTALTRDQHREPFVGVLIVRPIKGLGRVEALTATGIYTTTERQIVYSVGVSLKLK